jgi:hypothetical protein
LYDVKLDNTDLLRGDTAAQERRIKTMFYAGAWSPNKILQSVDENTLGAEGDMTYLPVNMIPADQVKQFWESKDSSKADTSSADTSGSGATNNNINQNGN